MDNKNPQITFDIQNPAIIILKDGTRIVSSSYSLGPTGLHVITIVNLLEKEKEDANTKFYYFLPWDRIDIFSTRAVEGHPIDQSDSTPQG